MITVDIDQNSGFCAGVIRAIGKAEEFLKENKGPSDEGKRLYSLGAIVHNDAELERLHKLPERSRQKEVSDAVR